MEIKQSRYNEMRQRIRNILLEALILESPLFKAVAVRYNGKVYEGKPSDGFHSEVLSRIIYMLDLKFDEIDYKEFEDGYITMDGKFVTRREASEMMNNVPSESGLMTRIGALVRK